MALLDSLLLNLQRETAPQNQNFTMNGFLNGAQQWKNFDQAKDEIRRNNSVLNLIRQRESDGVPYDRLSNEVAKFNPELATRLRGESRSSLQFNQQQSDIELNRFKREMADYWFGECLRRAQAEGRGPDEIISIAKEAAGLIAPYDSDLAYKLLMMANGGQQKADALQAKMNKPRNLKDDRVKLLDTETNLGFLTRDDAQVDPNIKKAAQDYASRIRKINNTLGAEGLPLYTWMPDYLRAIGNWDVAIDNLRKSVDWEKYNQGLAMHPYNIAGLETLKQSSDDAAVLGALANSTNQNSNSKNDNEKIVNSVEKNGETEESNNYSYVDSSWNSFTNGYSKVPKEGFYNTATNDINNEDTVEGLNRIIGALTEAKNTSNGDSVKDLIDMANDKIKEVKAELAALSSSGVKNPEESFKKFKNLFGQRASLGTVLQFRNFNAFVNAYISQAPTTAISNGLLVGTPNYKPTVAEINAAKQVHGDWSNTVRTIVQNMKVPVASQIASYSNDYEALWALGSDVQKQARDLWISESQGLTPAEYNDLKELYTKLFRISPKSWDILEGKANFPVREEYNKQLDKMIASQKSNKNAADLSGVSETNENSRKSVSPSEWLAKRRSQK